MTCGHCDEVSRDLGSAEGLSAKRSAHGPLIKACSVDFEATADQSLRRDELKAKR
jgi:hypothetical protein